MQTKIPLTLVIYGNMMEKNLKKLIFLVPYFSETLSPIDSQPSQVFSTVKSILKWPESTKILQQYHYPQSYVAIFPSVVQEYT